MRRWWVVCLTAVIACEGPQGPEGRPGIVGPTGDKGPAGPGAPAGIVAVFPRQVAVGLTAQIAISGTATQWNDATSVNFGSDIQVRRVKAASSNALVVDIEVPASASVGTRDISVTQGAGAPLTYRGVFQVTPLVTVAARGKPMRGSLMSVEVTHHDPAFEFDTSWTGSAFSGVSAQLSPSGVTVVRDVKSHSVTLLVGLDTDAALGKRDLRLVSSVRRPSEVAFSFPEIFEVGDLVEQSLAQPVTGMLAEPFDSALLKYTPAATGTELLASVATTNGKGAPMLMLVPSTGKFSASSMNFTNSYTFTPFSLTTEYRFLVADPTNTAGVEYAVSVVTPMKQPEMEPNEQLAMAQAPMVPGIISAATLSSATDVDLYKVTVGAGQGGRSLRVRSRAGDFSTDVRAELLAADGAMVLASADVAYHEDLRSPPLMPGDYFVRVSWGRYSTSAWQTYTSRYELLLNWE